jgi:hypothetical protein
LPTAWGLFTGMISNGGLWERWASAEESLRRCLARF